MARRSIEEVLHINVVVHTTNTYIPRYLVCIFLYINYSMTCMLVKILDAFKPMNGMGIM